MVCEYCWWPRVLICRSRGDCNFTWNANSDSERGTVLVIMSMYPRIQRSLLKFFSTNLPFVKSIPNLCIKAASFAVCCACNSLNAQAVCTHNAIDSTTNITYYYIQELLYRSFSDACCCFRSLNWDCLCCMLGQHNNINILYHEIVNHARN